MSELQSAERWVYLDLVGGIAGDMFIAALLDCCPELEANIRANVAAVLPAEAGMLKIGRGVNGGVSGVLFGLDSSNDDTNKRVKSTHYSYLLKLIGESELPKAVQQLASTLLTLLAKSEAKIHDIPLEKVHFHELADWDSLLDIVAAATILSEKSSWQWQISAVPIGRGTVVTEHGVLPVPAPATMDLLQGFEFYDDGVTGERVTPTGALILRYLKDAGKLSQGAKHRKNFTLLGMGYGLGSKLFAQFPNILRASVYENVCANQEDLNIQVINFEVDDMTGEEIAFAEAKLRTLEGVRDVHLVTVRGKKHRPMEKFEILVSAAFVDNVSEACFIYTSTIGLRVRHESRLILKKQSSETELGRIKTVMRPNGEATSKLESDELVDALSLHARREKKRQAESGVTKL